MLSHMISPDFASNAAVLPRSAGDATTPPPCVGWIARLLLRYLWQRWLLRRVMAFLFGLMRDCNCHYGDIPACSAPPDSCLK